MSQARISRSHDLARLRAEGYEIEIRDVKLVVSHVPYLNAQRKIVYGIIASALVLQGDVTGPPTNDHTVFWFGDAPHSRTGQPLPLSAGTSNIDLGSGPVQVEIFSRKPAAGHYSDYYEKITAYVRFISAPARAMEATATATTFRAIEITEEESVFRYLNTAIAREGIEDANAKLKGHRIAIIGAGGTGSYVLDLVAKAEVAEIHLFDGDTLYTHNAFRSPGAVSLEELRTAPMKVDWLVGHYSNIRRQIHAHPEYVDEANVDGLRSMDFVFLCIDGGPAKRLLLAKLQEFNVPFIDVGMGVRNVGGLLTGQVRVTTGTTGKRDHLAKRISLGAAEPDEYESNIQIVELNALNAALAVIRWKKHLAFYADDEFEHHSLYAIAGNAILNADSQCPG